MTEKPVKPLSQLERAFDILLPGDRENSKRKTASLPPDDFNNMAVGDGVHKKTGYQFPGVVVSTFRTTEGKPRLVVEHRISVGMLHIFNPDQMVKDDD